MSKPSSLGDIIGKVGYGPGGAAESIPELDDQQAKQQIRELAQSVAHVVTNILAKMKLPQQDTRSTNANKRVLKNATESPRKDQGADNG